MNIPQFLRAAQFRANDMIKQTYVYLQQTYKINSKMFSYATSYGQIMLVVHNISNVLLLYLSDSLNQVNMQTANRDLTIMGLSRIAGHDPLRGNSAQGEIALNLKADASKFVVGNFVYIPNFSRVQCINNGLTYLLNLGGDDITININNSDQTNIKIIEGQLDFQTFTGTGEDNQTFEVNAYAGRFIDDKLVLVSSNGQKYNIYDSLYEIPFNDRGCLVKTGITSGVDILFGNKITTKVPLLGEEIRADYLLTNGALGNIYDKTNIQFKFADTGFDVNGNNVDLNQIFNISCSIAPDFGANAEDPALTKILAPNVSRNFIIHDDKSIKYFLGRMNYFSTIKQTTKTFIILYSYQSYQTDWPQGKITSVLTHLNLHCRIASKTDCLI